MKIDVSGNAGMAFLRVLFTLFPATEFGPGCDMQVDGVHFSYTLSENTAAYSPGYLVAIGLHVVDRHGKCVYRQQRVGLLTNKRVIDGDKVMAKFAELRDVAEVERVAQEERLRQLDIEAADRQRLADKLGVDKSSVSGKRLVDGCYGLCLNLLMAEPQLAEIMALVHKYEQER